jgi:hypothetical protein
MGGEVVFEWNNVVAGGCFLVAAAFLLYWTQRRVHLLRMRFLNLEARIEAALDELRERLNELPSAPANRPLAPVASTGPAPGAGRSEQRWKALDLARQGAGTREIARTLEMQPAEIDLLLKVSRYQKDMPSNGRRLERNTAAMAPQRN